MSPKPLVAPAFLKTQFRETVEHWTKVTRDVARMIFVEFDNKTTKEDASGAQSAGQRLNRLLGFRDMVEDVPT